MIKTATRKRREAANIAFNIITVLFYVLIALACLVFIIEAGEESSAIKTAYADGVHCGSRGINCEAFCGMNYSEDPALQRACNNGAEDGRPQLREGDTNP